MIFRLSSPFRFVAALLRAGYAKLFGYQVLAPAEVWLDRRAICENCKHFDGESCLVCGCVVDAKAMLATESCPKKLWKSVWNKHTIR